MRCTQWDGYSRSGGSYRTNALGKNCVHQAGPQTAAFIYVCPFLRVPTNQMFTRLLFMVIVNVLMFTLMLVCSHIIFVCSHIKFVCLHFMFTLYVRTFILCLYVCTLCSYVHIMFLCSHLCSYVHTLCSYVRTLCSHVHMFAFSHYVLMFKLFMFLCW